MAALISPSADASAVAQLTRDKNFGPEFYEISSVSGSLTEETLREVVRHYDQADHRLVSQHFLAMVAVAGHQLAQDQDVEKCERGKRILTNAVILYAEHHGVDYRIVHPERRIVTEEAIINRDCMQEVQDLMLTIGTIFRQRDYNHTVLMKAAMVALKVVRPIVR